MSRKPRRLRPAKAGKAYAQLWRVVDGAIVDAFTMHPDYLTARGHSHSNARRSIAKRVTGALLSFVEQSARGPSSKRAERVSDAFFVDAHDAAGTARQRQPARMTSATGAPCNGEGRL